MEPSPPQRPLSCCFERKGFLAVGALLNSKISYREGASVEERVPGRKISGKQLRQKSLCLRTITLIVAPWKFDVLKITIFVLKT